MLTYSLKVERLLKETDDATTICFKQPGLKKIKYLAGQYITLIFRINGRRYARPYSFSSSPGIDKTLDVTIKRVPNGVVSNHVLDQVKEGDIIEVLEPMGDFTIEKINKEIKNKNIFLWGSGSGITPLFSIAKQILTNNLANHVTLVYGNRSFETSIFAQQLKNLKDTFNSTLSILHFYTRAVVDESDPYVIQGRIDPQLVMDIMKNKSDVVNTFHYICGPVGLKDSVKKVLHELGAPEKHIFSEEFEVIRDPKAFSDIKTQSVSININSTKIEIEVTKGKSILEAGLDSMLDLAYSCQTGHCLLCKAQIISGKIKTIGVQLPETFVANECLLCCSFPVAPDVVVSV